VAQYSVNTGSLNEAGEDFSIFAAKIGEYRERLESISGNLPEGMSAIRRQLAGTREAIYEISGKTRSAGMTLYEVSDHYTKAERDAISGYHRDLETHDANQRNAQLPKIRSSSGTVLFDKTILPSWLQKAVIEFEQSQSP